MGRWLREAALWTGAVVGVLTAFGAIAIIGFGYSLLIFRSGSMEPEIPTGSLALARTVDAAQIERGDVVSVETASGTRVTHRVVGVDLDGGTANLTLKGDANNDPDEETYPVTEAPRVVASVPWLGYVVAVFFSPIGLLFAGAFAALLVVLGIRSDRDSGQRPSGRSRRGTARRGRGKAALAGVATTVAVVTGVTVTDAAFSDPARGTTTAGSATYFRCDLAEVGLNPWAYWDLDDSSATAVVDDSGNNNPATFRASATRQQGRACGRDTGFSTGFAASTYATTNVNIAASQGATGARWNTFTVSLWFKSATATSMGNLINIGNTQSGGNSSSHDRHLILTAAGNLAFGVYPGAIREVTSSGADYSDTRWHMVTASLSSSGMKLWVDGQPAGSRNDTTTGEQYANMYWRLGLDTTTSWGGSPSTGYTGLIDEVSIWTRALSDTEVYSLYRAAEPNP